MRTLALLFWEFLRTGLLSVGGGLATLPFLLHMAASRPWFTAEELANMVAVSESTPGPIGINMATYAGWGAAGALGALVATVSLVLPSVVAIILVARAYERFRSSLLVKDVFHILRPVAVGMIFCALAALSSLALRGEDGALQTVPAVLLAVLTVLCLVFRKPHPALWIALGAAAGLAFL